MRAHNYILSLCGLTLAGDGQSLALAGRILVCGGSAKGLRSALCRDYSADKSLINGVVHGLINPLLQRRLNRLVNGLINPLVQCRLNALVYGLINPLPQRQLNGLLHGFIKLLIRLRLNGLVYGLINSLVQCRPNGLVHGLADPLVQRRVNGLVHRSVKGLVQRRLNSKGPIKGLVPRPVSGLVNGLGLGASRAFLSVGGWAKGLGDVRCPGSSDRSEPSRWPAADSGTIERQPELQKEPQSHRRIERCRVERCRIERCRFDRCEVVRSYGGDPTGESAVICGASANFFCEECGWVCELCARLCTASSHELTEIGAISGRMAKMVAEINDSDIAEIDESNVEKTGVAVERIGSAVFRSTTPFLESAAGGRR